MPIKKGNTTIGAIYKGTTQIAKVYKGTKLLFENAVWLDYYFSNLYHDLVPETILPSTYQEVKYIESSGTQYINLSFGFDATDKIETSLSIDTSQDQDKYMVAPSSWNTDNNRFGIGIHQGGFYTFAFGNQSTGMASLVPSTMNDGALHIWKYENKIASIPSLNISKDFSVSPFSFGGTTANLKLFYGYNTNTSGKIAYYKHWKNNNLVVDLVPCYRKSDSVIGLYDKVNGVFYTNAGTGTFTKGADVNRVVKNKAKVSVIEVNGVIENQLVQNGDFSDGTNNFTFESLTAIVSNNVLSGTTTGSNFRINQSMSVIANHKYLLSYNFKLKSIAGSNSSRALYFADSADYFPGSQTLIKTIGDTLASYSISYFVTPTTSGTTTVRVVRGMGFFTGDTFDTSEIELIDLTLMFGTGNEPTTLTDNRIQALLNRGYIPYNTGAYKGTDIGLFSSEPYNLLDLDRTAGNTTGWGWDNTEKRQFEEGKYYAGLTANNYFVSTSASVVSISANSIVINSTAGGYGVGLPIRVLGGETYRIEFSSNDVTTPDYRIGWYDKDGALISFNNDTTNKVAPQNAYWGVIVLSPSTANTNIEFSNICLHLTGTRTGYAPYQTFTPIAFRYQGNGAINAHDTMTITKDNVVFEKNIGSVDLGILNWTLDSRYTNNQFFVTLPLVATETKNLSCSQYIAPSSFGWDTNVNKTMGVVSTNYLLIVDNTYSNAADFKTAMSGQILHYELATPQVITIPRKHLGVVDLGTLNYGMASAGKFYINASSNITNIKIPSSQDDVANVYAANYLSINGYEASNHSTNMALGINPNGYLYIRDDSCSTVANLQAKLAGQYLFYETQDEVADILDTLDVEAGGTVNANWFSWVENQIVYDGNFANGTNEWYCQGTIYSQSASNNIMTVTKNASGAGSVCSKSNSDITYDGTHKLLALAQIKPSRNCTMNFVVTDVQTGQSMTANIWNTLSYFANPGSLHGLYFGIYETSNTLQVNDTVQIKNVMLIDLTQAFGAGNEPTDVNDPHIQYIINKGYIPTNTTGTYKLVDCEVLPNVEFKVKCK